MIGASSLPPRQDDDVLIHLLIERSQGEIGITGGRSRAGRSA